MRRHDESIRHRQHNRVDVLPVDVLSPAELILVAAALGGDEPPIADAKDATTHALDKAFPVRPRTAVWLIEDLRSASRASLTHAGE